MRKAAKIAHWGGQLRNLLHEPFKFCLVFHVNKVRPYCEAPQTFRAASFSSFRTQKQVPLSASYYYEHNHASVDFSSMLQINITRTVPILFIVPSL